MRLSGKIICLTLVCLLFGAMSAMAKGDTLTVAVTQNPKTMDPLTTDAGSCNMIQHMMETLIYMDKNFQIRPLLVEKWEPLPDNKGFTFFLKKGVKFHNGETMTADDVVFTFQRALGPVGGPVRVFSMYTAGVEKVDDYTIILRSKEPMGETFLMSLCHPWAAIVNKKAVEASGKDVGQQPNGTGPFKFKNWIPNERMIMERFDDYHGVKPKIKNLIFRTIVEAATRTIELESGAVDLINDPAPIDIKRIQENPDLEVISVPSSRLFYMSFDVTKKPYDDVRVREALSLATDREGLCKVVFRGYARPARGVTTSAIRYSKYDTTPPFEKNTEKAKKLLAEAGYPNGFKGKIVTSERTDYTGLSTIMQANFKEIGVDMEIMVLEWGAFLEYAWSKDHEPCLNNWWGAPAALDPFFLMHPPFHSSGIGTATNRGFYKDKIVDEALEAGAVLPNGPERAAAYGRAWDRLNATYPWVCLLEAMNMYGQTKGLKGIDHSPSILNYVADAYFEDPKKK